MTDAATFLALVERVEKATGADDRLAAEILQALFVPDGLVEQSKINGAWCVYDKPNRLSRLPWRSGGWPILESLDAIASLIERELPGWWWTAESPFKREEGRVIPAQASIGNWDNGIAFDTQAAATPALALCAAFLRAKASLAGEDASHG